MGVIEEIIEDSIPIWEECIETSFLKELALDRLDDKKMTKYIVEDTTYLTEYAKCFAYQIAKCKTLDQMRFFYSILGFVNESETSVRRVFLKKRNIDEIWAETRIPDTPNMNYIMHMMSYTKTGTLVEGLMAILPCMLSYEYIFMKLNKLYPKMLEGKYKDILVEYTNPAYTEVCKEWCSYANLLIGDVSQEEKEKLKDIFRQSSLYELGFWNMSYNNEDF